MQEEEWKGEEEMKIGKLLKNIAKGFAKALTLGLIGRGEKTKAAGAILDETVDKIEADMKEDK